MSLSEKTDNHKGCPYILRIMAKKKETLTLKVSESLSKDVGRAIARIDPDDMKDIGVEVGEIIEIKGKKSTPAKVMPCFAEDRGKGLIQIDGIIRDNAGVGLDEKVKVSPAKSQPATRITVQPLTLMASQDTRYMGRILEGIPLIAGNRVRALLFGTKYQEFKVIEAVPEGIVVIAPTTQIKLKTEGASKAGPHRVTYEDVGGLHKEIRKIREMIELPLKYPQIFERLGIEAPKGVFLYGPPGCGKTLIARAVASETDAYFTSISGPEIMGKFYGESEGRLREVFEDAAAHAPAILFIDEIDSIAPKREEMGGEKQVEKRVVAQLLALMDGLASRGQLIVIAATNIPNVIDPALRRPGRFDREISIPIPDKNGRLEILNINTRGMPLAKDVNSEKLAAITHGFVGADLEALCREAAMASLRILFPQLDFAVAEIPYEKIMKLEVTMDNFMEAMKEVEPSAIREVFVEVPEVGWEDIGGLDEIKENLKETIQWPLEYPQMFEKAATKPSKGILLYGAPGTGKTLLAKALAKESGVNFISVKGPELMSKYVGDSERAVREIFKKAKQAAPTILFFDEIESVVPVRGAGGGDSQVAQRVISQFLTELDGIEELKGVVVLAATNRFDMVDSALLRSGRFDLKFELPLPDKKTRVEIFKIHAKDKPLAKEVDFSELAEKTGELSGADIEAICRRASMLAIRDFIDKAKGRKLDYSKFEIDRPYFSQAIKEIKTHPPSPSLYKRRGEAGVS